MHFDGADFEDLTYRVSFAEADASGQQALQLHALTGGDAREDSATGTLVLMGRTGEAATGDGTRIWAGRIADSFYIDLSLLAIVNGAARRAPRSAQGQDDGVQGQAHACPHHCAVDPDVLQIVPEEEFQLARRLGGIPPLDGPGDQVGELVVELAGECPGPRFDQTLEAFLETGV